jgi:hypothetical protein
MRTLGYGMTLIELLQERAYTGAQLKAHPLTSGLSAEYDALHEAWLGVMASEIKLAEAIVTAEAMVRVSDGRLDQLLTAIVRSVLAVVRGDRSAPLYMRLLGTQRPSDAKRPVLGEQLELMRSWLPVLSESNDEALRRHADELGAAVAQADRAQADQRRAEQALTAFSDSGERKAFIDRFNALRHSTRARLQALAEQAQADLPETEFPDDFAEQFFQSSERARTPTLAGIEANIRRLEGQLAKQRALHEDLAKKRAARERVRAEAAERAIRAELAILEKEHSERQARIDALRARLPLG